MEKFMVNPNIDMYFGIRVTKDTKLEHKSDLAEQTVENLVLRSTTKVTGEGYYSEYRSTIQLSEGDVLILDGERGYIKPVEKMVTVEEAIALLECVKE